MGPRGERHESLMMMKIQGQQYVVVQMMMNDILVEKVLALKGVVKKAQELKEERERKRNNDLEFGIFMNS